VLSLVSFFARAKKETRPRCGEPQLGFEIARKARDTIQNLDARLRGHDKKSFRGNDDDSNKFSPHPNLLPKGEGVSS
jgi:hypothetical protein